MKRAFCLLSTAVTLSLATLASAQSPVFSMPPFVIPGVTGSQITWSIDGAIPHPFAILADLSGGPVDLFGERFYLGFSPVLTTLSVSPLSTGPVQQTISIPTVPGMLGVSIYGQPVVFDALAPNGVFPSKAEDRSQTPRPANRQSPLGGSRERNRQTLRPTHFPRRPPKKSPRRTARRARCETALGR